MCRAICSASLRAAGEIGGFEGTFVSALPALWLWTERIIAILGCEGDGMGEVRSALMGKCVLIACKRLILLKSSL